MCVFLESFWSKYDDNDVLGFGGLFSLEDNRVVKLQSPWFMVLSFLFFFFCFLFLFLHVLFHSSVSDYILSCYM